MSTRIALATGVTLDAVIVGPREAAPILFLHGFPESNRTWRHQIADLGADHFCVAPSQRGHAYSDKPAGVDAYAIEHLIGDVIALADAVGVGRFTIIGHDWGGAVAWAAALARPDRIARLVIADAPHPRIFQRSLIDDPAQRAASQYITAFRDRGIEAYAEAIGLDAFYDKQFARHVDPAALTPEDRAATLDEWRQPGALTAMLNWYRASRIVVPAPNEATVYPEWTRGAFPVVAMPTLVLWGLRDTALLPSQLDGLDAVVADLTIERIDAGHFLPWEAPAPVTAAIRAFLAARPVVA